MGTWELSQLRDWWAESLDHLKMHPGFYDLVVDEAAGVTTRFLRDSVHLLEQVKEAPPSETAYLFDYRFSRVAEQISGTNRHVAHFSASLVNALSGSRTRLIDVVSSTAELFATTGTDRWRRSEKGMPRNYIAELEPLAAESRMRLYLHERAVDSYFPVHVNGLGSSLDEILRLDFPPTPLLGTEKNISLLDGARTTLEFLHRNFDRLRGSALVVIVNGADREGQGKLAARLRRELVDDRRLVGIVDFPRVGRIRSRSAWIVAPTYGNVDGRVVMIDASALGAVMSHQDFGASAEFAGRLVRMFRQQPISARWATSNFQDSASQFRHVFDREFSVGYKDVSGLCRVVSIDRVRAEAYRLLASAYIKKDQPDEPGVKAFDGIDAFPIENLLSTSTGGKSVYVIGNNGEGKGLLLRRLALRFSGTARQTIGISCSATDRFPLPEENAAGFEKFTYEGARTSEQGADHRKIAIDICKKFSKIHCSEEQLPVFAKLLRLVDFDAKRYLFPMSASKSSAESGKLFRRIFELSDDVNENRATLSEAKSAVLQIALMRSDSGRGITSFRELSSGEQQIVSLIVKILVHATQGCVIIIDEPELSLHVGWQRVLPRVLSTIAKHFACDIVVATHSPLIISSAPEADSVCFSASAGVLTRLSAQDRRSVESVLMTGFGTFTANNRLIHERCAEIVATAASEFGEGGLNSERLRLLLNELGDMRRTVQAALDQLDAEGVVRSLDLIKSARETISKLGSLPRRPTSTQSRGLA